MEPRQLVPWAPPLILPTGGWTSMEHLEQMVRAYLRTRIQVTTIYVWRIDLYRNEILITTPGGDAYTVTVPTEERPKVEIAVYKGWDLERRAAKPVIRHP